MIKENSLTWKYFMKTIYGSLHWAKRKCSEVGIICSNYSKYGNDNLWFVEQRSFADRG